MTVRCRTCLATTIVPTGKTHEGAGGSQRTFVYDTNSKAALGKFILIFILYYILYKYFILFNIYIYRCKFISYDDLLQSKKSFDSLIESMDKDKNSQIYLKSLNPLVGVVSKPMLKRMAYAAISYESVLSEYKKGEKDVIDLLEQRVKGKAQVIKSKKVLTSILSYLNKKEL